MLKPSHLNRANVGHTRSSVMTDKTQAQLLARALPIAKHEFGHYIVAKKLKFNTGKLSLTIFLPDGHRGTSEIEPATPLNTIKDTKTYIENRVSVLYAGSLAETLSEGEVNQNYANDVLKTVATQDYAKARELIHLLRSLEYGLPSSEEIGNAQLKTISDRVWEKAVKIIRREHELIEKLAEKLASRITSSGVEVVLTKDEIESDPDFKARF